MINQRTIDKLIEMRLTSMTDAFHVQMNDTVTKNIPFEDHFGMLVHIEYINHKNTPEDADKKYRIRTARRQYSSYRLYF